MKFRIALAAVALLVIGMSGVASAQATTGNLVFVHGIPGGPDVVLVIYPSQGATYLADIPVADGTSTAPIALPADTHDLEVYAGEDLLGEGAFTIAAGATTTITATLEGEDVVVTVSAPVDDDDDDDDAETATPRPQTVTVPTRVETGAGGTADDGARTLVLGGLAAAVAAGALTLGLRRRSAA